MAEQLKAFISRSFAPEDRPLCAKLTELVEACDLKAVDLEKHPRSGGISAEIKKAIDGCHMLIAYVTARKGAIPEWIVTELNYAMDAGKQLVVFRQKEISPHRLNFLGDHFSLRFDRNNPFPSTASMIRLIRDAISRVHETAHQLADADSFEFQVKPTGPDYQTKIAIRRLMSGNPLMLTWPTVLEGLAILRSQIKTRVPRFVPEMIVGVNQTGGLLANALDFDSPQRPIAVVKTAPGPIAERKVFMPPLNTKARIQSILLVDSQLKSGDSIQTIMKKLRDSFGRQVAIHYAVLVACGIRASAEELKNCKTIETLFRDHRSPNFKTNLACLPQFLAYVTSDTVRMPDDMN